MFFQSTNENNNELVEKKSQPLVLNEKRNNNVKNSNNSIFKLAGVDIDMAERDRNVMAWVEKCHNQSDETLNVIIKNFYE